jgi:hypothetical protein
LWNSIARTVSVGQASRLPERAAASSYRFLAPMIGGDRAAMVVAHEFGVISRRHRRKLPSAVRSNSIKTAWQLDCSIDIS